MADQVQTPENARRALNQKQAAAYIGMSDKFLQSTNGQRAFPPVRIGARSVYYTDILDQQINRLAVESGALPAVGDA
jgi:predicted DNA-binding transcriptional regulator AlpA